MLFSWEKPERHIFHCTFHQNKPESKFETSFQLFQFSLPFRTFIYRICLSACVVHSHYDNLVTVCLVLDFLSYLWLWLCHDRLKPPERFRFGTSVLFEIYFLYRDWEIEVTCSTRWDPEAFLLKCTFTVDIRDWFGLLSKKIYNVFMIMSSF